MWCGEETGPYSQGKKRWGRSQPAQIQQLTSRDGTPMSMKPYLASLMTGNDRKESYRGVKVS